MTTLQDESGQWMALNESPSEKEGKYFINSRVVTLDQPSMKVPPKRKGNVPSLSNLDGLATTLNESPSEKEGKF